MEERERSFRVAAAGERFCIEMLCAGAWVRLSDFTRSRAAAQLGVDRCSGRRDTYVTPGRWTALYRDPRSKVKEDA